MVAVLSDISPPAPWRRPELVLIRSHPEPRPRPRSRQRRAVYRWRRTMAAGLVAGLLMALWVGAQAVLGHTGGGPLAAAGGPGVLRPAAARIWIVRPGDTIWSIAATIDPQGDERPLVDRLSREVHGAPLFPGEQLAVP